MQKGKRKKNVSLRLRLLYRSFEEGGRRGKKRGFRYRPAQCLRCTETRRKRLRRRCFSGIKKKKGGGKEKTGHGPAIGNDRLRLIENVGEREKKFCRRQPPIIPRHKKGEGGGKKKGKKKKKVRQRQQSPLSSRRKKMKCWGASS